MPFMHFNWIYFWIAIIKKSKSINGPNLIIYRKVVIENEMFSITVKIGSILIGSIKLFDEY